MLPVRLLLLPGLDGTGRLFAPLLAALPREIAGEVVAYPPDDPLDAAALAALVAARLPREGRWLLLGESFSGPIALRVASARPPGLAGVVLAGSYTRSPLALWRPLRALLALAMHVRPPRAALRALLAGRDAPDDLVDALAAAVRSVSSRVLAARLREVLAVDADDLVRACPVPLLALTGARDRLVGPRSLAHLRALRPDLTHVELDAPHLMLQRRPQEAALAIADFVRTVA